MRPAPLLALALAAATSGCGAEPQAEPGPIPPTVQVLPLSSRQADVKLIVDVVVAGSGCKTISKLSLLDHQQLLGTIENADARSRFEVPRNSIDYRLRGIAAALDLHATVVCDDGRTADSQGVAVQFLPVDETFTGTFATTVFSLDPSGQALVSCIDGKVVRLSVDGTPLQSTGTQLGFSCTQGGGLQRGSARELYWQEPSGKVARLKDDLTVLSQPAFTTQELYLPPEGSGFAVLLGQDSLLSGMQWLDRTTGAPFTASTIPIDGIPNGTPALGATGLVLPLYLANPDGSRSLATQRFNLATGRALGSPTVLATLPGGQFGTAQVPRIWLSRDGTRAFFVAGETGSEVRACASDRSCASTGVGGGQIWTRTLTRGPYTAAIPINGLLFIAGPQGAEFVDQASGSPIANSAFAPTGGLSILSVLPGAGTAIYVLCGTADGTVTEVVLLAAPGQEAARFGALTGSIGFDLDGTNRPYLLDQKLVRLLLPSDYFAARQPR